MLMKINSRRPAPPSKILQNSNATKLPRRNMVVSIRPLPISRLQRLRQVLLPRRAAEVVGAVTPAAGDAAVEVAAGPFRPKVASLHAGGCAALREKDFFR